MCVVTRQPASLLRASRPLGRRLIRTLGILGLLLVFTACSGRLNVTPVAVGDGTWRLPAANWTRDGGTLLCAGGGWIGATIHGSPNDPAVVWVDRAGSHLRLAWPSAGYTARFTPSLEVLDASGAVVFREGDAVAGGCETGDSGTWQIDRN